MPDLSSYRTERHGSARPSIGEIRRRSGLALIAGVIAVTLLAAWGLIEFVALIVARFVDHPSTARMLPSAVESVIHVTNLM